LSLEPKSAQAAQAAQAYTAVVVPAPPAKTTLYVSGDVSNDTDTGACSPCGAQAAQDHPAAVYSFEPAALGTVYAAVDDGGEPPRNRKCRVVTRFVPSPANHVSEEADVARRICLPSSRAASFFSFFFFFEERLLGGRPMLCTARLVLYFW
jgi:hypothetical protein